MWKKPGFNETQRKVIKKSLERQDVRSKISANVKAAFARPGVKDRHSAAIRKANLRTEVKAKQSAASRKVGHAQVKEKHRSSLKRYKALEARKVTKLRFTALPFEADKKMRVHHMYYWRPDGRVEMVRE